MQITRRKFLEYCAEAGILLTLGCTGKKESPFITTVDPINPPTTSPPTSQPPKTEEAKALKETYNFQFPYEKWVTQKGESDYHVGLPPGIQYDDFKKELYIVSPLKRDDPLIVDKIADQNIVVNDGLPEVWSAGFHKSNRTIAIFYDNDFLDKENEIYLGFGIITRDTYEGYEAMGLSIRPKEPGMIGYKSLPKNVHSDYIKLPSKFNMNIERGLYVTEIPYVKLIEELQTGHNYDVVLDEEFFIEMSKSKKSKIPYETKRIENININDIKILEFYFFNSMGSERDALMAVLEF